MINQERGRRDRREREGGHELRSDIQSDIQYALYRKTEGKTRL